MLIYKKQTKPKYKDEKHIIVQMPIDGLNCPLQPYSGVFRCVNGLSLSAGYLQECDILIQLKPLLPTSWFSTTPCLFVGTVAESCVLPSLVLPCVHL